MIEETSTSESAERVTLFRASFAQRRMWFLHQLEPDSPHYNIPVLLSLSGPVHRDALHRALAALVARHESLRTTFVEMAGGLMQVVAPEGAIALPELRIGRAGSARTVSDPRVRAAVLDVVRPPFDLTVGPLLRARLLEQSDEEYLLVLVLHHIVIDGWSIGVLCEELRVLYIAEVTGRSAALPPMEVQIGDIAEEEPERLAGRVRENHVAYWRSQLAGDLAAPDLPFDRDRPDYDTYRGGALDFTLQAADTAAIASFGKDRDATTFMILLAAFYTLLYRYNGSNDHVVGVPMANREDPRTAGLIGLFVNTVPLRARFNPDAGFVALLEHVRQLSTGAYEHQGFPLDQIVEEVSISRTTSHNPLAAVLFAVQAPPPADLDFAGIRASLVGMPTEVTRADLELHFWPRADGLTAQVVYSIDLFDRATIEQLRDDYLAVLRAALADPHEPLAALPMRTDKTVRRHNPERLDEGVAAAGIAARRRRDGSALPARIPRGCWWDGDHWVRLETVETVLLGSELIDDCAVLPRQTTTGVTELVAYFATSTATPSSRVSDFARATLPPALVPRAFVPVAALPVTSGGALDTAALQRLAVIDDDLIRQFATRLSPGTCVRVVPDIPSTPRRRIDNAALSTGSQRSIAPETDGADVSETDSIDVSETDSAELAVLDGGPPIPPEVASLPAALRRAAHLAATTELIFLEESGAETILTYALLLDKASRVLGGLRARGLAPGDLVIVNLSRPGEFVIAVWGCFLGGIVPVPVEANSAASAEKVATAGNALDHPMIIGTGIADTTQDTVSIDELLTHHPDTEHHQPEPDDLALLLLTSGSTGSPKAVMLTHHNILARSAATAQLTGANRSDTSFNWMPLEHVGGLVMFHVRDVYLHCRQIHAATSWLLADPLRWLVTADRYRVTNTWAPNFAFDVLADRLAHMTEPDRFDLTRLRFVLNGGEAIVPRTARRVLRLLRQFGLPPTAMRPAWGMSETSSGVVFSDRFTADTTTDADEFTEVGRPIPGVRIRIVDEAGGVARAGSIGRVHITGPTVTKGYYRDGRRTREAFTADGWFDTGDLGRIQHGALTLTGRVTDTIVVNGVNYPCHAIESAVEESPHVMRSCVAAVAVRSPGGNTDALALIFSLRAGVSRSEAFADIRSRVLAVGPNPDFLVPVSPTEIPKTDIGKIQRSALRKRFAAGEFTEVVHAPATPPEHTVPNWFFQPAWDRRDRLRRVLPDGEVLLVGASGDIGTALVDQLRAQGIRVVQSSGADSAAVLEMIAAQPRIRTVVCFTTAHDETRSTLDPVPPSIFAVIRVVSCQQPPAAVYVVGWGALAVTETEVPDAYLAAIPALLRSAAAETPGLRVRFVDFDPADRRGEADQLIAELGEPAKSIEVAYRSGVRWVRGLRQLPESSSAPVDFTPGALHLISGGMGGLARELAWSVVERFAGRVLLVGRHGPDAHQIEAYQRLRDMAGDDAVRFEIADVTNIDQLRQTVRRTECDWHTSLSNIWHLAGEYQEGPLAAITADDLREKAAAKIVGAQALHRIALHRPGIRFVSFSSVNGFFGGATVAGYSVANAYLDAFTHWQRSCGIAAHSVAWTMWDGIGMSSRAGRPDIAQAMGYHVMGRSEGFDSLWIALAADQPHVLVGLDDTKPAIRAHLSDCAPADQALVIDSAKSVERLVYDRYGSAVPTRIESNSPAHPRLSARDDTEQRVSVIWREVLGTDDFGVDDTFFDVGGNSLLLARVQGLLSAEFGYTVRLVDLFRYPTISGIATYLLSFLAADRPAVDRSEPSRGSKRAQIRRRSRRLDRKGLPG